LQEIGTFDPDERFESATEDDDHWRRVSLNAGNPDRHNERLGSNAAQKKALMKPDQSLDSSATVVAEPSLFHSVLDREVPHKLSRMVVQDGSHRWPQTRLESNELRHGVLNANCVLLVLTVQSQVLVRKRESVAVNRQQNQPPIVGKVPGERQGE
tara:strand:+ start:1447 stop:1911 length:465 start_codon:yes stop_codon:yes gene_type:complete